MKKLDYKFTTEELREYLNNLVTNGNDDLFLEVCHLLTKTLVYFPINENHKFDINGELLSKEFLDKNYIFFESIPLVIDSKYYQPIFISYEEAVKDMPPRSIIVAAKFYDICTEYVVNDPRMEGFLIDPRHAQVFFTKDFLRACIEVFDFVKSDERNNI